ncbi:MAG TPA: tetratricopeptide repeat protein [Gammaproteobacteria bacterium]|nr:tetratricopeptide repeat protein [Gammaproteobacteria bacterium]
MSKTVNNKHLILMPNGQNLPVSQAMDRAVNHHQLGRVLRAAEIYRKILNVEPTYADAKHLLGIAERQQGNFKEAIKLINAAIKLNPGTAVYYNNLSQAYRASGDLNKAGVAGKKAISLDANIPEAHVNIGAILFENGDFNAAIEAYKKALSLRKGYIDAMLGLGDCFLKTDQFEAGLEQFQAVLLCEKDNIAALTRTGIALRLLGRIDEAIEHYKKSIVLLPSEPDLYNNLSCLYQRENRPEEAAECLRVLLKLTPDDVVSRHSLNALEGSTTETAPAEYVRELFDNYADDFDSHLVDKLGYHTPEMLLKAILSSITKHNDLAVLDLGCGTGLMGDILHEYCAHLSGVDLAPKMIDQARNRGIYHELAVGDVLEFMGSRGDASLDLVVAADVFVYIGKLDALFCEARRLLSSGGIFSFSVEVAFEKDVDFLLNETGRYSHSKSYLNALQASYGFSEEYFEKAHIRNNHGKPVYGYLCVYSV